MTADYADQLRAAIEEAEAEAQDQTVERRFYALGLRVAAGLFGLPEGVDPDTRRRQMPDPMPVFVIKGKDLLASPAVDAYRDLCSAYGLHEQADQVRAAADEIRTWQDRHIDQVKAPDHIHVPAGGAQPAR